VVKMSLDSLNNKWTDKNSSHSYFDTYERLLSSKRNTTRNVLEIGIAFGGSIKLWHDYFPNAIIHGADILPAEIIKISELFNNHRVMLHTCTNAYSEKTWELFRGTKFDVIVDDGSHILEDMIWVVKKYSELLDEKGILIIEDIQEHTWLGTLQSATPDELKPYVEFCDLRNVKEKYDDILFVINKNR